jgi:hypothetical protein
MRQRLWIFTLMAIAVFAIGCNSRREGVIKFGDQTVLVTDEELTKYVVWWREDLVLVNHNIAEMETVRERVAAKYSFAELERMTQDPELLGTLEGQRSAMQELDNRRPVDGLKMQALRDTVPGVATLEFQGDKVVYVPGRDEIVLAAARKRYGDQFVDWIVARESAIARILSQ